MQIEDLARIESIVDNLAALFTTATTGEGCGTNRYTSLIPVGI